MVSIIFNDYFMTIILHNLLISTEPFAVSFVETVYTVDESVGGVNVCVTLNYPEFEINFATVNVFVIDALNYSQTGTPLASELSQHI